MEEKILSVLEEIRPHMKGHFGDVEFVDFDKKTGIVHVRFLGACSTCPMSNFTLKAGIESVLREKLPFVKEVKAVL